MGEEKYGNTVACHLNHRRRYWYLWKNIKIVYNSVKFGAMYILRNLQKTTMEQNKIWLSIYELQKLLKVTDKFIK